MMRRLPAETGRHRRAIILELHAAPLFCADRNALMWLILLRLRMPTARALHSMLPPPAPQAMLLSARKRNEDIRRTRRQRHT